MFRTILLSVIAVAGIAVAVILALAATKPDEFRIARSASINAAPEKILPLLADPRAHRAWSPFEQKDPDMKRAYSGAPGGAGAIYEWDGDSNIGAGRMEMTEASAQRVSMNLIFLRPMEVHNTAEFLLVPEGAGTMVTWAMQGPVNYPAKIMHVFFDMDRMIGGEFETGLTSLKAVAER